MADQENPRDQAGQGTNRPALVVFCLALAIRLIYLALINRSPYYDVRLMTGTDNFYFYEWAGRIADGDLIGAGEFYLPPLYPYLLALLLKASGDWFLIVPRLFQALMGAATAGLTTLLAGRLWRPRSALFAGLLVALHGPLIFYEAQFLRSGLLAFLYTLLLYCMVRAQQKPGKAVGFAVGALWATGLIAKPTIVAFVPAVPVWGWLTWSTHRGSGPDRNRVAAMVAAGMVGFALFSAPLLARNAAARAPIFSISRRGALELAAGNLPGPRVEGWFLTREALELTLASDRRLTLTAWKVLLAWRDRPWGLVRRQADKAGQFFKGYEIPNNVNYYVEREYVWLFRLPLVSWPLVLSLGILGIWARRRGWREAFVPLSYVGLYSVGVVMFYVLGRFRLALVPALCVFGGAAIDYLLSRARKRDPRVLAAVILALILALLSWHRSDDVFRPDDYYNLMRHHLLRREPAQASKWIDRGRASLESRAGRTETSTLHYYRAWYRFLAGEPLEQVAADLEPARSSNSPVNSILVEQLERELDRRRHDGDPRPLGFRFLP